MALAKTKAANQDIHIGISAKMRENVAHCLAQVLADTYILQLRTQYYHWNVTGESFFSLHTMFGAQYEELAAAVDEIAERVRSLGAHAPGTFREFAELSSLKEDKYLPSSWRDMVANLAIGHETLAREAREKVAIAQKASDEGTADLFIRRLQAHEKAAWFLRSHL